MSTVENETVGSSRETRKKRIEDLCLIIGGFEESIRLAQNEADWSMAKELKDLKVKYYKRLRNVIYGFPEA